jgi:hypothetical protein
MFLADVIPDKVPARKERGQAHGTTSRPSKQLPAPVTEKGHAVPTTHGPAHTQWQPIPVFEETADEKEARRTAALVLGSALGRRADPKRFLGSIPKPLEDWEGGGFRVIETSEDYWEALRELEDFW